MGMSVVVLLPSYEGCMFFLPVAEESLPHCQQTNLGVCALRSQLILYRSPRWQSLVSPTWSQSLYQHWCWGIWLVATFQIVCLGTSLLASHVSELLCSTLDAVCSCLCELFQVWSSERTMAVVSPAAVWGMNCFCYQDILSISGADDGIINKVPVSWSWVLPRSFEAVFLSEKGVGDL